ncbi:uncharacterized protein LOC129729576 isoform X2 [Wyeomyia smithii]|uniref:uncharacterized protein LOC129729576 isoform X2 n=1 Tax=Wyeomyia smithii TaxID=174621 RepID=UPI002467B95F|nr:uncharacterized protein LOC129729576 isoform X2 [Wyeomyia smithii]
MPFPFRFCIFLLSYLALVNFTSAEYRQDLCLNGSLDDEGKCICGEGYVKFEGNCFLARNPPLGDSHVRTRSNSFCPPGYNIVNGRCQPTVCKGTLCGSSCPPGYELKNGFCEIPNPDCPPGTTFQNGFCYFQSITPRTETIKPIEKVEVVPPLRVDIPIPEFPLDPLDPKEPEPNTSTHNVNNVYIHLTRTKSNGAFKAVVIRNNETTVYEERPSTKQPEEEQHDDEEDSSTEEPMDSASRCCIVVSPRICRKQEPDEWVCFHRKHYHCGSFCTAEIVYLRPRRPQVMNSFLVMPPAMNYPPKMLYGVCRWGQCPRLDCSGCLHGSYRCHINCYTYDCAQEDGCHFVNQEDFCDSDRNDELCTSVQ